MTSRPGDFPLTGEGPLRLYSTLELLLMPPPEYLIDPIMPEGGMVALYGAPGTGKSFVALDIALSVGTGRPWQGHPVKRGYVVYVSAEGGTGIGKRVLAWLHYHGVDPKEAQVAWLVEPIPIHADSEQVAALINRIVQEIGVDPSLVVIDTMARCFDGDENETEDMGRFVAGVDHLRHELKCTVLVIHHTRLDGTRERGNTSFKGAADTMMAVEGEPEDPLPKPVTVRCKKQKDDEPFKELVLDLIKVDGTKSAIVTLGKSVLVQEQKEQKSQEMLQILRQQGPTTWDDWFSSTGYPKTTFHRIFVELRNSGQIIKENGQWEAVGDSET